MSYEKIEFTRANIDVYLKEVAKEYRKLVGKGMPAEIIIIGGGSVLLNYGFRDMTTDIDAYIRAASGMKDAINRVRDKYDLPNGWLNDDFQKTDSFSDRLVQFSEYYRTYSNVVTIRTVKAEYLIAMKLKSGRRYKYDISDVMGILMEQESAGESISLSRIRKAAEDLYGSWEALPDRSRKIIVEAFDSQDYKGLYERISVDERENRELLIRFEEDYPGVTTGENVDDILDGFERKGNDRDSLLGRLRESQERSSSQDEDGRQADKSTLKKEDYLE